MKNRIRILATTDMHGYIYPYRYADGLSANYGTARLKTAIDQFRDENTLLVDNGDVLQGSSLQFHHFAVHPDEIAPITISMNAMEYDYINLGNHDFDFGEEALINHIEALHSPCITANVFFHGKPFCPSYAIREVAGKKIALFGLVTHFVPKWEKKKNVKHFQFKDAYATAKRTVELIRKLEKPDYVICLYHGGYERDIKTGAILEEQNGENQGYRMLREIPGLDILITGHTHTQLCGKAFKKAYAQPGKNGEAFACIDIYTDTGVIEPRLIEIDTEPDETMMELTEMYEKECQTWLDTPLATTSMNLKIEDQFAARLHKSQVVTFLNHVMLEASGADISASPLFKDAPGFRKEITMRDLVSTYLYPNTLVIKQINGAVLKAYLEQIAEFWALDHNEIIISPSFILPKFKPYNYDMLDGIEYTIKVSNPIGQRVISLKRNGEEITDDMEFTLCLSNYRANGGGDFDMIKDAPAVREIQTDMVELLANWMIEHKTIEFEPVNNIQVIR